MSIKKVRLQNFRGFRDAEIELKPLTVLLGPNSAGKSSFGHALAAMAHAHRVFSGTPQASLTPASGDSDKWPIDLGNLEDLRTFGANDPVRVTVETDGGLTETGFGLDSGGSLLPSYFRYPKSEGSASAEARDLPILSTPGAASGVVVYGSVGNVLQTENSRYYEVKRLNENQWREDEIPSIVILDGLVLKAVTHERGTSRLLSGQAQKELEYLFNNLAYLRATRKRPSRTYRYTAPAEATPPYSPAEIGYAGEWTANVLHRRAEESVQYGRLPSIPNSVGEAEQRRGERVTQVKNTLLHSATEWLRQLGLAASVRSIPAKSHPGYLEILMTVPDQREQERNLIEIGFGTSQVLPILTAGLLQPPGSLFIVDLPEAHLHPRPQADLADFFCSLALSGRFNLVETHSEMFFHRLRLRAEMDEELKSKIAVYFIDKPADGLCRPPRRVGLGLPDQFRWPVGFLQEAWEVEGQIELVRQSKVKAEKT